RPSAAAGPTMRWTTGATLALVFGVACAGEEPLPPAAEQTPCGELSAQAAVTACWTSAARAAETELQARWALAAAATKAAGPRPEALLRQAQAHWQRFRNTECELMAARFEGGSAASMAAATCRWRLARARSAELQLVLDDWRR